MQSVRIQKLLHVAETCSACITTGANGVISRESRPNKPNAGCMRLQLTPLALLYAVRALSAGLWKTQESWIA